MSSGVAPFCLGLADRRIGLEEQPDALEVAPLAREEESGGGVPVSRPNARAALEQQPHRLGACP